jgi:hypothetical protein
VSAVAGVIVGLPLGIAIGRWLWTLFAQGISAVPDPNVPVPYMAAVAVGALVFANLAAVFPGRIAARTPTALLLRTEVARTAARASTRVTKSVGSDRVEGLRVFSGTRQTARRWHESRRVDRRPGV